MHNITVSRTAQPRTRPPADADLGFGRYFTDHAFVMRWTSAKAWHDAAVVDRDALPNLNPAAKVLHYGQGVFEGMKAFAGDGVAVNVFRPDSHIKRMNDGAKRLSLPTVDFEVVWRGLTELLRLDRAWIPTQPGQSLYLRPVLIGTEPTLGVSSANECLFYILASPVGSYYKDEGSGPVRILATEDYVRAFPGGTGAVKAIGNYAGSLLAADIARNHGYAQVLWLDAVEHRYIEEVGTMNLFLVIDDVLVTPTLSGTIIPGITRDSIVKLSRDSGLRVEERRIAIDEVVERAANRSLTECFGTGTAVVVSPVSTIGYRGQDILIGSPGQHPVAARLLREITELQRGGAVDRFGWLRRICTLEDSIAA